MTLLARSAPGNPRRFFWTLRRNQELALGSFVERSRGSDSSVHSLSDLGLDPPASELHTHVGPMPIITRALTLSLLCATTACSSTPRPLGSTSADHRQLFAMQSNFWVNLHHFLYVTARARRGLDATRPAVTQALADTAGFGTLSAARQADWNSALDYYTRVVADRDILFDTSLVTVNVRLSRVTGLDSLGRAGLDVALTPVLERAAPVYREVWWTRHDSANRAWIAAVRPLLAQHGDSAAAWEARAFGVRWADAPVPVDVSAYANWAGAYTTEGPSHVTISSLDAEDRGTAAFETLFHEVLHTMDGALLEQFGAAAAAQGKRTLRDPTHPFIFYTAGEVTRRLFPGHVPFAESGGLWARSRDLGAMRPLLQRHWQPWLDGQITLEEALHRIAAEL